MLRRAVLASGLVVGLGTSVVCAAAGVGLVAATRGLLEAATSSPMPRLDVHLLDLLLVVAVGTGTALAAAVVPALQAGRQDVVSALAGRRGQAAPRRRVAVAGVLLVGAGLAIAVFAAYSRQPFLVALGLALGEFGLVALSGTLIALAARVAPRLPLASRLALRDAARQRGRTAPAVAAVLAVVAGCSAVAVYTAGLERHEREMYFPQAAQGVVSSRVVPASIGPTEAAIRSTMPVARLAVLHQIATVDDTWVSAETKPDAVAATRSEFVQSDGQLLVDDGSGLAVLLGNESPAVRAALTRGRAVAFRSDQLFADGTIHVRVHRNDEGSEVDAQGNAIETGTLVRVPATYVDLPLGVEQPVLPPSAVPLLGKDVRSVPFKTVASTTRMPTQAEEQRLQALVTNQVVAVERGYSSPYPLLLLVIIIASVVVALGSTLAVVGLSAAEGRADVATLAAVGAPPRVRRRLAAAQAGVVAVLGTLLGSVSGVVSGITLVLLSRDAMVDGQFGRPVRETWEIVMPWRDLGLLAIALPLLAVLAAAALTRSRLPMVRRLGQ